MFMMHWGLLNKPFFDPPYVGVFLEAFLTNGDWRILIANGLQLVLAVALYWPFFKIMEKQEEKEELERLASKKADIFTSEDEALLEDLDF